MKDVIEKTDTRIDDGEDSLLDSDINFTKDSIKELLKHIKELYQKEIEILENLQ